MGRQGLVAPRFEQATLDRGSSTLSASFETNWVAAKELELSSHSMDMSEIVWLP